MRVVIYTDGSCDNDGNGAYAGLVLFPGKRVIVSGSCFGATSNRTELLAVLRALCILKKSYQVKLITDSRYVQTIIRHEAKRAKTNLDIIAQLLPLVKSHDLQVCRVGRCSDENSTLVDKLAKQALVAQRIEHQTSNLRVGGSSPSQGTGS